MIKSVTTIIKYTAITGAIACGIFSCTKSQFVQTISIDEKIGQMLMIGFRGFDIDESSTVVRDIREFHLGGVILFNYDVPLRIAERNIQSKEQLKQLTSKLQEYADTPLFIAVDQEGGRVARLKPNRGFGETRSAEYLGELDDTDSTQVFASRQAALLKELGFSVNFAPVVDVNTNPENPVIGSIERSFSPDPGIVTKHASIFLEEFEKQNILGVLKHFPGHGSAWNDSHYGMADVTETWQPLELIPYRNLIESNHLFAVMTAHILNKNLDPDLPATLSENIQTGLLRDSLNYEGLLFSDDMQMEAIRSFYGLKEAINLAINAGIDILVFGNNSIYVEDIIPQSVAIIKELLEEGKITEKQIDDSYNRIIQTKISLFPLN